MKNKKEFFEEFFSKYGSLIEKSHYEKVSKNKKKKKKYVNEKISLIILNIIFIYIIYTNQINTIYKICITSLFCLFALGLSIVNLRIVNNLNKDSCYIINALIYDMILNFLSNKDFCFEIATEISESDFNRMNLFNMNYLKYTGSNLTAANYKNKKFVMCDVWLYDLVEMIKTDSYYSKYDNTLYITNYHYHDRINIFKGLYYETTINRENNKYIYMIPNNLNDKFIQKNIYHYISYSGTKIELENLEFSERYSVFSFDEIKSRYILSLTLMEKINRLDKLITNKKYFVFKPDGRVGIFIDEFQLDDIFNRKFNINKKISKEHLYNIYITVNKLFDISQILEDFNPYS